MFYLQLYGPVVGFTCCPELACGYNDIIVVFVYYNTVDMDIIREHCIAIQVHYFCACMMVHFTLKEVSIVSNDWSNSVVFHRKQAAKPLVKFIFVQVPPNPFHVQTIDKGMRHYLAPLH